VAYDRAGFPLRPSVQRDPKPLEQGNRIHAVRRVDRAEPRLPYFVHSGFGKDLREVQGGVSVAKLFERGIPGLIVQGRYSFGFTEQAVDIPHNRSLASIEVGYLPRRSCG
jgi:hypothetical protein